MSKFVIGEYYILDPNYESLTGKDDNVYKLIKIETQTDLNASIIFKVIEGDYSKSALLKSYNTDTVRTWTISAIGSNLVVAKDYLKNQKLKKEVKEWLR